MNHLLVPLPSCGLDLVAYLQVLPPMTVTSCS